MAQGILVSFWLHTSRLLEIQHRAVLSGGSSLARPDPYTGYARLWWISQAFFFVHLQAKLYQ